MFIHALIVSFAIGAIGWWAVSGVYHPPDLEFEEYYFPYGLVSRVENDPVGTISYGDHIFEERTGMYPSRFTRESKLPMKGKVRFIEEDLRFLVFFFLAGSTHPVLGAYTLASQPDTHERRVNLLLLLLERARELEIPDSMTVPHARLDKCTVRWDSDRGLKQLTWSCYLLCVAGTVTRFFQANMVGFKKLEPSVIIKHTEDKIEKGGVGLRIGCVHDPTCEVVLFVNSSYLLDYGIRASDVKILCRKSEWPVFSFLTPTMIAPLTMNPPHAGVDPGNDEARNFALVERGVLHPIVSYNKPIEPYVLNSIESCESLGLVLTNQMKVAVYLSLNPSLISKMKYRTALSSSYIRRKLARTFRIGVR